MRQLGQSQTTVCVLLWKERKEFQPGCYSDFAVFAENTSVKNSSAKQIGWIREDDKPLFLKFTNSTDDIEE